MNFLNFWPFKKRNTEPKDDTPRKPSKKAICVGINDYPGTSNDLQGCVNDARDWAGLLKSLFKFEVLLITNAKATAKYVKEKLLEMILNSVSGDKLAFTYSGHGTTTPDSSGDEADGRDEAICCYDGLITDDELREIISKLPEGVSLTIISDSCHSGTITRAFLAKEAGNSKPGRKAPKPKFMPPPDIVGTRAIAPEGPVKKMLSSENMTEVLLTGCKPTEYSYDAYIGGKYSGALSATAIKIIKSNPNMTWNQVYAKIKRELPSKKYPQTPQLEGNEQNLNKPLFS